MLTTRPSEIAAARAAALAWLVASAMALAMADVLAADPPARTVAWPDTVRPSGPVAEQHHAGYVGSARPVLAVTFPVLAVAFPGPGLPPSEEAVAAASEPAAGADRADAVWTAHTTPLVSTAMPIIPHSKRPRPVRRI